ncbi:iron ABC transporter permease [Acidocella sp. KAb 2-4]|uniref:ABC transporter permease n=1 Tax=Acidocella sp. KAb 2-4 TaxID=2885158 RepID=UPI001D08A260|nr:iron ABC transporter permease [Acidocella sp. KAb 2-4]MCB5945584.1 iron ABC transporter permease [Acidocella sp. KAb 2-4]
MRSLRLLALALLAFLFAYPLARLLALPLAGGSHGAADALPAFINSAGFALLVGAIVAPLGAGLAQALETRAGGLVRGLDLGLWLLFLTPGYVLTTGWLVILTIPAVRNGWFGTLFLGPGGLVFLYTLKALPFAVFVARGTFASASASLHEAALVLGIAPWRRRLLDLRLALPAMAAAFTIAAIETMQEFGIPATLGVTAKIPILTYAIYGRLNTTPTDFTGAAMLCWWLIGSAALLAAGQMAVQRRHQAALVHGKARPPMRHAPAGAARWALGLAASLLWGLGLAAPLLALAAVAAGSQGAGMAGLDAVTRSLGYGAVAATLALGAGIVVLKLQQGRSLWFTAGMQGLLAANMAVPGLVLGAGYVIAFNNDLLPLYGTALLLIIAYAAGALPASVRLLGTALAQFDGKLDEAARIFALPLPTRLIDIEAALLARPGLYAWLLVVAAVMFELPVSELLYVPGEMPLGVAIVSADMMAQYGAAARLALLGMAAMAGLTVALTMALRLASAPRTAERRVA